MADRCDVSGCGRDAARSVPRRSAETALKGLPESRRRVQLCKEHHKEFKKATKESRELDRLGWE